MARQLKLTDLQLVLLSAAAARADGMVLPPPESVRARGRTLDRTLQKLLKLALVAPCETTDPSQIWRQDEAGGSLGLAITAAGRAALGLEATSGESETRKEEVEDAPELRDPDGDPDSEPGPAFAQTPAPFAPRVKPGTKQARLVDLLSRPTGATIGELVDAFGWRPHTTRAALTGLRRKGYQVNLAKDADGRASYRATPPAGARDDAA
ncbi:DUF3489 domain-containing protein [Pikeienuella sp. HZG-20]|uniref:DUF3489 domain-containing protein n=1 Tax=Paludibacillus litoralis TaxID=3133267 RepID=UPI0030EDC296